MRFTSHWHGVCIVGKPGSRRDPQLTGDTLMQWTTPSFTDMRFGFEITMYIATR
jgi:coenzyme PQQ precursor peptide PqqA